MAIYRFKYKTNHIEFDSFSAAIKQSHMKAEIIKIFVDTKLMSCYHGKKNITLFINL